jgi:uncharacterized protein YjbI with pentapeptide repeats
LILAPLLFSILFYGTIFWGIHDEWRHSHEAHKLPIARIKAKGGSVDLLGREGRVVHCSVNFSQANIVDEDLLLVDDFPSQISLNLTGTNITDAGIEILRRHMANRITSLNLSGTKITDQALVSLESFTDLSELDLSNTAITDAELSRLLTTKKLYELNFAKTRVTDKGLKVIGEILASGNPYHSSLDLSGTQITDAGLEYLDGLKLDSLKLSDTDLTDAGIQKLSSLQRLRSLNLSNTRITDKAFESFKEIKGLDDIVVRNTSIANAALTYARAIPKLRRLDVTGTKVTKEGISDFLLKKANTEVQQVDGP